jgi:hypothetical protein
MTTSTQSAPPVVAPAEATDACQCHADAGIALAPDACQCHEDATPVAAGRLQTVAPRNRLAVLAPKQTEMEPKTTTAPPTSWLSRAGRGLLVLLFLTMAATVLLTGLLPVVLVGLVLLLPALAPLVLVGLAILGTAEMEGRPQTRDTKPEVR